jgi:hypothetical protein
MVVVACGRRVSRQGLAHHRSDLLDGPSLPFLPLNDDFDGWSFSYSSLIAPRPLDPKTQVRIRHGTTRITAYLTFSPVLLLLPAHVRTRNIYLLLKQGNKPDSAWELFLLLPKP